MFNAYLLPCLSSQVYNYILDKGILLIVQWAFENSSITWFDSILKKTVFYIYLSFHSRLCCIFILQTQNVSLTC